METAEGAARLRTMREIMWFASNFRGEAAVLHAFASRIMAAPGQFVASAASRSLTLASHYRYNLGLPLDWKKKPRWSEARGPNLFRKGASYLREWKDFGLVLLDTVGEVLNLAFYFVGIFAFQNRITADKERCSELHDQSKCHAAISVEEIERGVNYAGLAVSTVQIAFYVAFAICGEAYLGTIATMVGLTVFPILGVILALSIAILDLVYFFMTRPGPPPPPPVSAPVAAAEYVLIPFVQGTLPDVYPPAPPPSPFPPGLPFFGCPALAGSGSRCLQITGPDAGSPQLDPHCTGNETACRECESLWCDADCSSLAGTGSKCMQTTGPYEGKPQTDPACTKTAEDCWRCAGMWCG